MEIVAENLTFTYSAQTKRLAFRALDGVSVDIKEGEFFGIIGRTGSGKTTFVQHLNGLIKVQKDSGRLLIGDYDLTAKKCDYKSLRAKVGMLFQYPEEKGGCKRKYSLLPSKDGKSFQEAAATACCHTESKCSCSRQNMEQMAWLSSEGAACCCTE